ncbi:hypothetical protein SKAU_G00222830 [Synaphobranchus kaupii]|uniref:Fibronectin type-III domain-containing protein n=1 Tax=Synaphobranchus kaupii TaxID=118154 RepID=A0A9Q1FB38_SYNKA|nr:hypothetical protein SKAU_G00222830 [Synaphobranchus kaupii]
MRIWTTFFLLLGVWIDIQVQCFQEGMCPQKDPPRGVQVLAPGTEVTLHCSGRISVNGADIARTGTVSTGKAKRDVRGGTDGGGVRAGPAEEYGGVETVAANQSGLVEELDLASRAGERINLTREDRGSMNTGPNGSEAGGGGFVEGAVENANASDLGVAYHGALEEQGRAVRGLRDRVQWRVNGRLRERGGKDGDTLQLGPLRLGDKGNYSCHRGGRKVFSVEIIVAAPLEQPTLSCYRKMPTSKIRCDWTANQTVIPTPQCYLILEKGLYSQLSKVSCSFSASRARCWCVMEPKEGEDDAFDATLCLTSITGNVTSPTIQIHPQNIIKPDPPTNVTVRAEEGMEHRLKVTWKYPLTWRQSYYYLDFQLQYFPILNGEAMEVQNVSTKKGHHVINDIVPRTTYLLRVRAREEFGLGQWSDWSRHVYGRSWAAPEPSATIEVLSSSEIDPFYPFITGSGEGSGNEFPPVSSSLLPPKLTFHLSWVLAACVLVTIIVLAVFILRHREQFMSKLLMVIQSSTSRTPAPPPSQLPREGNPLVSPEPSTPPSLQEEERGEGIHLNNMGYFLSVSQKYKNQLQFLRRPAEARYFHSGFTPTLPVPACKFKPQNFRTLSIALRTRIRMSRAITKLLAGLVFLLSCCTVHGLECQVVEHANGSASYNVFGGRSSTNCSTEWMEIRKVIAFKDEVGEEQDDNVLAHYAKGILLKTCSKAVHYQEECPASGEIFNVPCPCNCSNSSAEGPNCEGEGCNRTHVVTIVTLVLFVFLIFPLAIVCFRKHIFGRCGRRPQGPL